MNAQPYLLPLGTIVTKLREWSVTPSPFAGVRYDGKVGAVRKKLGERLALLGSAASEEELEKEVEQAKADLLSLGQGSGSASGSWEERACCWPALRAEDYLTQLTQPLTAALARLEERFHCRSRRRRR